MIDREGFKLIAKAMASVRPTVDDQRMIQWEQTVCALIDTFEDHSCSRTHIDGNIFIQWCRDA